MSSRRPLQPVPALSANVPSTRYDRVTTAKTTTTTTTTTAGKMATTTATTAKTAKSKAAGGSLDMQNYMQDDVLNSDSAVSGLTSLSGDDEFERFMIEKAREERRRLGGREQAFRKARARPRVGLTMDNLQRNDAHSYRTSGARGDDARTPVQGPPSSSGSTRSDPAIHAPAGWGRKGRTSRDWMRAITRDEPPRQTPAPTDGAGAGASSTDSPLSHKSFQQGPADAARQDSTGELDLTFDMNEASMLVSTPYMPRITKLDDLRELERETASLREERLPMARLETTSERAVMASVERQAVSAERPAARPFTSRRSDSQDLLRRLARASNTPSPKGLPPPRSQTEPAPADPSYIPAAAAAAAAAAPAAGPPAGPPPPQHEAAKDTSATATTTQQEQPHREQRHDTPHDAVAPDVPPSAPPPLPDVDATPMPTEQPVRNPRTPHVMGGWVDTPGPRTAPKPAHLPQSHSQSPKQDNASEPRPSESSAKPADHEQTAVEQSPEHTPRSVPRPRLPSSALHALVQEARAHHDYGDDTMHSLEELLGPVSDSGVEEDTLQGLTLPTSAPRSEAERERHAETVHIHRLREHLRATETNVRDVGRGMRRLETLMEHSQTGDSSEKLVLVRSVTTEFSPWLWFRSFFWDERIKAQRQAEDSRLKIWGGVTLFGILLTLSFIYWASETIACEIYCHPEYASYSPYPFSVNVYAPRRGRVIPTLIYRALFKSWSKPIVTPIASLLSWIWSALWTLGSGLSVRGLNAASYQTAADAGYAGTVHTQASRIQQEQVHEEDSWEWSMAEDEVLRR